MVQLDELTGLFADEVAAGRYPFVRFDARQRWHRRIYRDRTVDVWLISWLPTQGTQLHDHGGSAGAFTVLSGELTESVPSGFGDGRVRVHDSVRPAGGTVHFGRHYIHDVRNLGAEPAVSVHAYSPPLTSMSFYDLSAGELVRVATVATEDPETELGQVA